MSRNALFIILASVLIASSALPAAASVIPSQIVPEACTFSKIQENPQGCTVCHIGVMLINITNFTMFALAIPAVALLVAAGGIMILISGGSEERLKKGKNILTKTVVGAVIVFLAWLGVDTTFKVLTSGQRGFRGAIERFGPWNKFPAGQCNI